MKSPHGLMCTIVSESKYCSGMTRFTTFSITSLRKVSNVTFSECWSETTTVWTRFGMQAPWSNKYSHVTYKQNNTHFNITFKKNSVHQSAKFGRLNINRGSYHLWLGPELTLCAWKSNPELRRFEINCIHINTSKSFVSTYIILHR